MNNTRVLGVLAALAAINLVAGVILSAEPPRTGDLQSIAEWTRLWTAGGNPYAAPDSVVDYPPWALVMLAPLGMLPASTLGPVWVAANLVLLACLIWRLTTCAEAPAAPTWALALLFASMASARTLSQFSLLAYTLGLAGAFAASRGAGGVLLGLSLMKPHIGGVALLWCLLRRDWQRAAIALAVPLSLAGVFALRADIDVASLLRQYVQALTFVHGAESPLAGHTELRGWLIHVLPRHAGSLWFAALLGGALLLPAVIASRRSRPPDQLELLALCGAASLVAVRHMSYDFLLLWPAVAAWRVPPFASRSHGGGWPAGFAVLSLLLVAGLPSWARLAATDGAGTVRLLTEIDRVVSLGTWGALSVRLLGKFPLRRRATGHRSLPAVR